MRVTHVITRLIVGGAQENTVSTVLGLARRPGLEVQLISGAETGPEGTLESAFANAPHLLQFLPQLVRPIRPARDFAALRALTRRWSAHPPAIVHTHSGKAGIVGRLAAARASVPVIIHTIHGPSFGTFQGRLSNALFLNAERIAGRVTTHFISVADAMTRQYLAARIGRAEQFTTIRSGFDLEPFLTAPNAPELRARLGLKPDDLVVGTIGRLFPLKGHDDIITAVPRIVQAVPRARFLFVGDGPERSRLERRIADAGLQDRFVFAGLVPPDQVSLLVGIMDLLIHLSRREGLARALPQALAAAKPVIAYDCDGASEVCRPDETGLLIAPDDLDTLVQSVRRLANNPGLREAMGNRGRELVRGQFAVETMVESIYQLYRKLSP